jgi:hypothetical protein
MDNIEIAQFVYLLLRHKKIRDVIDTIGRKAVLILGRFSDDRKKVLEAIRKALTERDFIPIVFDFERPTERDFTETIMTLAGMCLFVVADITQPRSAPLELQATVPNYMIPFVPILQKDETPFSMFADLQRKFSWVLETRTYGTVEDLIEKIDASIIKPALEKHKELVDKKARCVETKDVKEFE